ncbi:hypothetical protein SAMN05444287_1736 [Octadecabacter temperatus]|uniref:Uncharacterized protein n=1 Tax=Octadecabacter temperatus TaxID=1458307 RepID=A0A0K0Y6M4_9RHOB|nr:hypothetical protein [Octadecabacter temperatus]AKS46619.1 hypothetical protein OSB_20800 [Octadecabacter temperatus]SIO17890.1 hypothetical protein SAMN05444287_1736 [Octadecabacter temperatus]
MSDKPSRRDFYSGIPWVNVTAQEAHAHPLGKLGPIEWVIVVYFIGISILKFWLSFDYGMGLGGAFLNSIWPFLVGLGLALRVPWAVIMAMISAALTAYALVRGLGGGGDLITLFEMIASVGILFYLIDADRPNLIYRHRYRKYSVEDDKAA